MPLVFSRSEAYGNTRIIIDATELFIQKPSDLSLQSVTWSNYKSRNTLKGLVGICPFGGVTFVSDLWAGSISDNELTLKCGLIDLLESGDNIMADKGFTIDEHLHSRGVTLNIPPFMKDGKLAEHDVKLTREIATLRIHVERAIERIKNFKILKGTIPNNIPAATVSKIFYVCAMFTNLQAPLVSPIATQTGTTTTAEVSLTDVTNQSQPISLTPTEVKKRLTVTPETQRVVQLQTKDQSKSKLWHELRSCRLTSSNFGRIIKRTKNFEELAKDLLHKHYPMNVASMPPSLRWGVEHEPIARRKYECETQKHCPTLCVVDSGLWIDTERGWLASSPDGIVVNANGEMEGIVEIKCPFTARDMTPIAACEALPSFPSKLVNGEPSLKKTHNYFYQVQGQLAITGAKWCDFCIYTPLGISIERIVLETHNWKDSVQKLDQFFDKYIIPLHVNVQYANEML